MFRISLLILSSLTLTACAGSAYHLPEISHSEMQSTQAKLEENPVPLKKYQRSDQYYKDNISKISQKLTKHAKPLCEHTGYNRCYFEAVYDSGNELNAYASEGYKITLYKGILEYLKNEDEIAAVIAHEMGHHLANHNEEKLQNAQAGAAIAGILTAVLVGAAQANNPYYSPYQQQQDQQTIGNMMQAGAHIGALSYSKEQEREADLLAAYMLSRAGYNLQRAQNTMVVLNKFEGDKDPMRSAFLGSHPTGVERVVAWEKAIEEIHNNPTKLPYAKPVSETAKTKTQNNN